MSFTFDPTKALVHEILSKPHKHEWSLQGFGMLRTYLPGDVRLHVWDDRYAVKDCSLIHTHPWDFESYIVAGVIENIRYFRCQRGYGQAYHCYRITPGMGLQLHNKKDCDLQCHPTEVLPAGMMYRQRAEEIHSSHPHRGSVTIVQRKRAGDDLADVYCNPVHGFVSAEPRMATTSQVEDICSNALKHWF